MGLQLSNNWVPAVWVCAAMVQLLAICDYKIFQDWCNLKVLWVARNPKP